MYNFFFLCVAFSGVWRYSCDMRDWALSTWCGHYVRCTGEKLRFLGILRFKFKLRFWFI